MLAHRMKRSAGEPQTRKGAAIPELGEDTGLPKRNVLLDGIMKQDEEDVVPELGGDERYVVGAG